MSVIAVPYTFSPGIARSAEVNANFSEIQTKFNATAVQTDVAKTISAVHTFAANVLFTDNLYDIGASGATRPRDLFLSRNLTVGGTAAITGAATFSSTLAVAGAMTAAAISTATSSNSTANGATWTTAYGLSASRSYFVTVSSDTSGQDAGASAIYYTDSANNVRILSLAAKAGTALSVSGSTITVVNTTGATQNYVMNLTRLY